MMKCLQPALPAGRRNSRCHEKTLAGNPFALPIIHHLFTPYICRMKILMVCLGNICRSPLAQGILEHKVKQAGLDWTVDSAGTGDWHVGETPHKLSQKVAKLNGVDICEQSARQFNKTDMLEFDKIYVMDNSNYKDVKQMSGELWDESKVGLFLNELYPGRNMDVPDPWYGEEDGYHKVYELIEATCDKIIEKYSTGQNSKAKIQNP
jgi:protein-tyrosine phosphatase